MNFSQKRIHWSFCLSVFFMIFCTGYGTVKAAPAEGPMLVTDVIEPAVQIDIPWDILLTTIPVNVTDNDVDDTCPSLSNGNAFWFREGEGLYRWQTSQDVSTASKVVDTSLCMGISAFNDKVAFNSGFTVKYWDGSTVGTVTSGDAWSGVSLYDDAVSYSWADGSDFEIVIQKGFTREQVTSNGVWDVSPSLYNGTVAWVHDFLGAADIYYWDGEHTHQITDSPEVEEYPSLYDGTIAWAGYDGSDYEIFYWNGSQIIQITNDTDGTDDQFPSLYDGKIAWQRNTANGWEIFYYDGSSVKQITNNTVYDKHPSLYNGAILWEHYDGHDWEIQYAEVDVPQAPTVSTLAATDITQTTANINGSVNPNGQATTYHFEWGTSTSYDHVTPDQSAGSGSSSVNVYQGLTSLTPGTTYHYRLVAVNPSGTTESSDRTFTTIPVTVTLPTLSTGDAANVTATTAHLTGTVNPSGAETKYRFEYGGNSTSYGSHTGWLNAGNGSADVSVAVDITGLTPGTTYHYRLVAENSAGTVNGDDKTFTTEAMDDPMEDTARRFTGWWYNKNEPGTGVAMEIKNGHIYLAWFTYDEDGTSTWYSSGGSLVNDTTYTGDLWKFTGWPWGEDYQHPVRSTVGTVTVVFNKGSVDSVLFNASVNGHTETDTLSSFMADFSPGDKDSRNLNGWWWDSSLDGTGFFFDARGGKMAMVWYNYRDDSSPRWWTSDGPFADGAASYDDMLDGWQGGKCPGCTYTSPNQHAGEGGSININFSDADHATLTVGDTTLNLVRFDF